MWTFLGLATFTYFYKKCGDLVTLANKELLLCALLFLSLGLVLSYRCRARGGALPRRRHKGAQLAVFADVLAALPFIGFFWAKSPPGTENTEQPGSRKVGGIPGGRTNARLVLRPGVGSLRCPCSLKGGGQRPRSSGAEARALGGCLGCLL